MKKIISLHNQQGYLTIITIVMIIIIGFLAVTLAYITFGSALGSLNFQQANAALYLAESALEDGTHELLNPIVTNRSACSGLNLTNNSIGGGAYTLVSSAPSYTSSPTTTSGTLAAAATTVPVASTANYQSSGRIMIDQEYINYAAVNATNFLYAQRGVGGTAAVAHASGTRVGQYQCPLSATGGIPSTTLSSGAAGGRRLLKETVTLEEAWTVGDKSGNNLSFTRWNRPTELTWSNYPVSGSFALNSISMISYVDGWAVGASPSFLRWNGTTWNAVASGLSNVTYNSVYCYSANNCHAVGNMVGGSSLQPTIADWNGTTWTQAPLIVLIVAGNQRAVHCSTATDCWSVGGMGTTTLLTYFYRWNGSAWSNFSAIAFSANDFPFNSVFCTSPNSCWAVGGSSAFGFWDGLAWTRIVTALPSVQYNSVFCNSASDCWVVGNKSTNDVIGHWDGSSWSLNTSNPTPATNLNAVRCLAANNCWAAGASKGSQPSFIHWDGTSWTTFSTSGLPNVTVNALSMIGPQNQPTSVWTENFG